MGSVIVQATTTAFRRPIKSKYPIAKFAICYLLFVITTCGVIRPAVPSDASAAVPLILNAIGSIAFVLTGTTDRKEVEFILDQFFRQKGNRVSYENALVLEDSSVERSRNDLPERSREGSLERSREGSLERSREGSLERSREGSLERSREGSLEGSREGPLERSREGSLEGSREGSLERSREGSLERSREGSLERSREVVGVALVYDGS